MNDSKRFLLLSAAVVVLGIVLGTALWLKLEPQRQFGAWNDNGQDGLKKYGVVPDFSWMERSGALHAIENISQRVNPR
jgi:hypothetical protein